MKKEYHRSENPQRAEVYRRIFDSTSVPSEKFMALIELKRYEEAYSIFSENPDAVVSSFSSDYLDKCCLHISQSMGIKQGKNFSRIREESVRFIEAFQSTIKKHRRLERIIGHPSRPSAKRLSRTIGPGPPPSLKVLQLIDEVDDFERNLRASTKLSGNDYKKRVN